MLRCYIPARLSDNPLLLARDPGYAARWRALPEPYRTASLDGDWDIFLGQAFAFSRALHVIRPRPVPDHAPLLMTFDWGYGAPFSVGWWWVDADGRLFRFAEWYGTNGSPNQGLRLTDSRIAAGIAEREARLGLAGRAILRLAGPDCFAKKPDYRGGGQGPSTAEVFGRAGLVLAPGDPSRVAKIRQFPRAVAPRERRSAPAAGLRCLRTFHPHDSAPRDATATMWKTSTPRARTISTDEACHACMARPLARQQAPTVAGPAQRIIDAVVSGDQTDEEVL
jgi:hypothetical protein